MIIRLKIREVAEAKGVENAAQLSRRANVAQSAAYNLWNGVTTDPGLRTLAAIAQALDVRVCDLFEELEGDESGNQIAEVLLAA